MIWTIKGCKDIHTRKFEFVSKTQFLYHEISENNVKSNFFITRRGGFKTKKLQTWYRYFLIGKQKSVMSCLTLFKIPEIDMYWNPSPVLWLQQKSYVWKSIGQHLTPEWGRGGCSQGFGVLSGFWSCSQGFGVKIGNLIEKSIKKGTLKPKIKKRALLPLF